MTDTPNTQAPAVHAEALILTHSGYPWPPLVLSPVFVRAWRMPVQVVDFYPEPQQENQPWK